jgi:hypothetical protein
VDRELASVSPQYLLEGAVYALNSPPQPKQEIVLAGFVLQSKGLLIACLSSSASLNGLARYHAPYAASRVLHIALTTRDQVHVSVANSLSCSVTAVNTNIEAAY